MHRALIKFTPFNHFPLFIMGFNKLSRSPSGDLALSLTSSSCQVYLLYLTAKVEPRLLGWRVRILTNISHCLHLPYTLSLNALYLCDNFKINRHISTWSWKFGLNLNGLNFLHNTKKFFINLDNLHEWSRMGESKNIQLRY